VKCDVTKKRVDAIQQKTTENSKRTENRWKERNEMGVEGGGGGGNQIKR
jgi:hypothetical protein